MRYGMPTPLGDIALHDVVILTSQKSQELKNDFLRRNMTMLSLIYPKVCNEDIRQKLIDVLGPLDCLIDHGEDLCSGS